MTWDKFQRTVLPSAERIEFLAPSHGSYTALVTAANAEAPPILQWDRDGARNPVSWYFWNGGSSASQFGLSDVFVQPLWLGWTKEHWDLALGYGFYAPTGVYDTETLTLLARAPGRAYGADDLAAAQDLAGMTSLAIDNAAGSDRPEVLGYTAPPRSAMLSLSARFR